MKTRRRQWFAFSVVLILVGVAIAIFVRWPRPRVLASNVQDVLENAPQFVAFSLEVDSFDGGSGPFVGRNVLGQTVITDRRARDALRDAFYDAIANGRNMNALCFAPRHGLRAAWDGHTVDLLICFECSTIKIYVDGTPQGSTGTLKTPEALFDKVLTDAGVRLAAKPGHRTARLEASPFLVNWRGWTRPASGPAKRR